MAFVPFLGAVLAVAGVLGVAHWLLIARHPELGNERKFPRQLVMLGLTVAGLLAVVLTLPISEGSRNQLVGLVGILLSAMLALSSTTVVSNLMAGLLLRITGPFRVGDFIRVGGHFGRVTERGLFDTEIQTETRELIALPNTFCISNPVATIRSSGTILSVNISLGYDLDRRRIEALLIEAAAACELAEPFVHIVALGDHAVSYRVSGFLGESKRMISAQSRFHASVLDTLHRNGIEIVSPAFMNQRRLPDGARFIPVSPVVAPVGGEGVSAEAIAFDKAEQAEARLKERQTLEEEIGRLELAIKDPANAGERSVLQESLAGLRDRMKGLREPSRDDDEPAPAPGATPGS